MLDFPRDFLWGSATASYQVEGATHEGGRSESIWDTFPRRVGATYAGENADVSCDQYHRYKEDVKILADLGFKSYRFSLAWPRILPQGEGAVNPEGIAYYRNLCAELHKYGIQACATLYHWDLPQCIEDKTHGWASRTIVDLFRNYAELCFKELGDCVDQWFTINEPQCVSYVSYLAGVHAPGVKGGLELGLKVAHHVNLAHGAAVKSYRETGLKAPIGPVLNISTPRPATSKPEDVEAAEYARRFEAEVFLYPLIGKGYPDLSFFGLKSPAEAGDLDLIAQKIDFVGINYYFEHAVAADPTGERRYQTAPFWQERTDMGWPIVPTGLGRQLSWVHEVSGGLPIYITENGFARPDVVEPDGRVHDRERIDYLQKHLKVCSDLIKKGINLKGYFIWSLLDNFEWAQGFTKRFGIIHVDYFNQKRTPKDSAYFFRDLIAGYGDF
ncbi:beta-glucosidase [Spirochaetia bacterium]|nr:beta-glucosidase [Spirochaetia bacterium]GHU31874.1 beta-glucosidase [Spirochaetia bacterium]